MANKRLKVDSSGAGSVTLKPQKHSGQDGLPFSDIRGHWAEKTITEHAGKGFLKGYPDGTFRPDQGMRRSELVALINRYFGLIQQSSDNFADVKGTEWYAPDTARARYYGYLEGLKARPEEFATREDVVGMVSLLLDLAEQERSKERIDFSDIGNLEEGTKENILAFSQMGYLQGYPDGTFRPDRIINRAEIMTITENVLGYIVTSQEDLENIPEDVKKITVIKPDIVIKDKEITADIYITPGTTGNITIQNSTIKGKLEIGGGSKDKPIILENVTADKVIITKAKEEPKLEIKSSDIEELKVKATTKINTDGKTAISTAKINAGAEISGEGRIKKAYIDSDRVKLEKKPEYTEILRKDIVADVNGRDINQFNDDKYHRRSSSGNQTPQLISITGVEITGTATVGEAVYASISPDGATVTYQWQRSNGVDYEDIVGAVESSYVLTGDDEGKQIRAAAEGTGDYTGTAVSNAIGPVIVDPVTAKIREGWIPVANKQELKQIEIPSENTFGAGTKWEGTYTGGMDKKYMLVADIDLSGENFVPIGYDETSDTALDFTGSFSGEGYRITNLIIDRDKELQGLFSRLGNGALITGMTIENASIKAKSRFGALAGEAEGARIEDSVVNGVNFDVSSKNSWPDTNRYLGGFVGKTTGTYYDNDLLKDLTMIVNEPNNISDYFLHNIGGITGLLNGGGIADTEAKNIHVEIVNDVSSPYYSGIFALGGLVGELQNSSEETLIVDNNRVSGVTFIVGNLNYTGAGAGGLIGRADTVNSGVETKGDIVIKNSTVQGLIQGKGNAFAAEKVGGFIGYVDGTNAPSGYITIDNCSASVDINELDINPSYLDMYLQNGPAGGFASKLIRANVTNSYADGDLDSAFLGGGGFAGWIEDSYIDLCGAEGDVLGYITGGFAMLIQDSEINRSYVAGLVGESDDPAQMGQLAWSAGGFASWINDSTLKDNYFAGQMKATEDIGGKGWGAGFVCNASNAQIHNAYVSGDVANNYTFAFQISGNTDISGSYWNATANPSGTAVDTNDSKRLFWDIKCWQ